MALKKTSVAKVWSMRINTATSAEDSEVYAIVQELKQKGFSFKQIAQDAILRSQGHTPEMFSRSNNGFLLGSIEDMLSTFAKEILSNVKVTDTRSGCETPPMTEDEISPFAKKFANSYMQRQQKQGNE